MAGWSSAVRTLSVWLGLGLGLGLVRVRSAVRTLSVCHVVSTSPMLTKGVVTSGALASKAAPSPPAAPPPPRARVGKGIVVA